MRHPRSVPPLHALTISVLSFILFLLVLGLFLAGCSSPTAPSDPFADLRWELTAPGCTPIRPVPTLGEPAFKIELRVEGKVYAVARWLENGRVIDATFHAVGPLYALCTWSEVSK